MQLTGSTALAVENTALRARIAELEAALRALTSPAEYPDIRGFHSGVRSVYGQAVYEGRSDTAAWMTDRWPAALTPLPTET